MVKEITDTQFEELVEQAQGPVLVDFWAPWCGPCKMLGPVIEEVASEAGDKAKIYKINIDDNPQVAGKLGISSIPTVVVFRDGEIAEKLIGVQPKKHYLEVLGVS
jgi:thioredoxin 1